MALSHVLMVSGLMAVAIVVASRVQCERPWGTEECMTIAVRCRTLNESECTDEGSTYFPRGSFCGYCDICGTYVGYKKRCNVTMEGKTSTTALCQPGYVCSGRSNGICVRPKECIYEK